MDSQDLQTDNRTVIHRHRGKNYLRYISLILLIGFSSMTIASFFVYAFFLFCWVDGLAFFPVLLGGLKFGLFCIRFPRLTVYDDGFIIEKRGFLAKFNDYDSFKFTDIKRVYFSPGFTDKNYLIVLALFGSGGYGGNNKADQMIVNTNDDQIKVFNRVGGRHDFIAAIDEINKRLRPAANKM
jgi:hypothetical protein